MAYTILNNDGSLLTRVADDSIDQSTSVTFVGRDYSGYGQYYNQNLVTLLTNSANANYNPPANPVKGQLWYDTTFKRLRIYDNGFTSAGGATVSAQQPAGLGAGDFWYDSTNQVLNFYNGFNYSTLPSYPIGQPTGWISPTSAVLDNSNPPVNQQVTLIENYGNVVGALSQSTFVASFADSQNVNRFASANTSSYQVFQGLNIIGNISANGNYSSGNAPYANTSTAVAIGLLAWDVDISGNGNIYISINTATDGTTVNWLRLQVTTRLWSR